MKTRIAFYLADNATPGEVAATYLRISPTPSWLGYRRWCKLHKRTSVIFTEFAGMLITKATR